MELVAERFASAIRDSGPNSVAYYGSGQALSEESYLANRLFKGGIGTNNVEGKPAPVHGERGRRLRQHLRQGRADGQRTTTSSDARTCSS